MTIDVPSELANRRQWINWRLYNGRKIPIDAKTNRPAKSNDPKTWTTLSIAMLRGGLLGFVFAENGGLVGIDLDGCIVNGILSEWAKEIVNKCNTYTEVSPSGTGLKMFAIGSLKSQTGKKCFVEDAEEIGGQKRPAIEAYDWGRFFAFTGKHWKGTPFSVNECSQAILEISAKYWPKKTQQIINHVPYEIPSNIAERAAKYLERLPPAVSGQGGHDATFRAANVLVNGFALSVNESIGLLEVWNARCVPPWSDKELLHKLNSAAKSNSERGYLLVSETPIPKKEKVVMASFNQTTLLGNVTRDVELKYLQSGTAVCELSIAVNDKRKQGEKWIDEVSFFDVTCWGRTAEIAGEYVSKGSQVLIAGKLKQERWEKDGQKHSKIKVVCETLTLLGGSKRDQEPEAEAPPSNNYQRKPAAYSPPPDEIPF